MLLHDIQLFIQDPQNAFGDHLVTTLKLSFVPTLLAILIALPLGVVVAARPISAFFAINVSGLARSVPTLVFLAAALPYLGIGFTPAAVALTLLGIPPILLNVVAGLRSIDPAATDAARGMGMTAWQVFTRIQVPLVLPVLAAGVRTSAVQIVATTPLAALIGAGGLGDYILGGINLGESGKAELVIGGLGVALLALVTEVLLAAVQRLVTPAGVRVEPAPADEARDVTVVVETTPGESVAA